MITIKEIARLAGVSPKTAERALSGATKDIRRDARERAERVRKIAEAHGYRPSELALSLRRGGVRSIGFITDILTDQFLSAAVETVMDEAAKQQYRVALQVVRFDPEQTLDAIKSLLASGVQGIITSCCPEQLPETLIRTLEKQNYPLLTLCGRSGYDFSGVASDYSAALEQAVKSLRAKGHRKIVLCLFAGKPIDNARNESLFRECCQRNGVEAVMMENSELRQAATLADKRYPAVILYGKYSMRIYLDRCKELGYNPDVVGIYNEWTLASARNFPLHGIILEPAECAVRQAVQQVLNQIAGEEKKNISMPAEFIPASELRTLHIPDLTNQRLFDFQ